MMNRRTIALLLVAAVCRSADASIPSPASSTAVVGRRGASVTKSSSSFWGVEKSSLSALAPPRGGDDDAAASTSKKIDRDTLQALPRRILLAARIDFDEGRSFVVRVRADHGIGRGHRSPGRTRIVFLREGRVLEERVGERIVARHRHVVLGN